MCKWFTPLLSHALQLTLLLRLSLLRLSLLRLSLLRLSLLWLTLSWKQLANCMEAERHASSGLQRSYSEVQSARSVLIIGGGAVGVELAGQPFFCLQCCGLALWPTLQLHICVQGTCSDGWQGLVLLSCHINISAPHPAVRFQCGVHADQLTPYRGFSSLLSQTAPYCAKHRAVQIKGLLGRPKLLF